MTRTLPLRPSKMRWVRRRQTSFGASPWQFIAKPPHHAESRGLILADTKFEFGTTEDGIVLADEVLTPDSSRFWEASTWKPGGAQPSFDKQFVRDYLESIRWNKQAPAPSLPDDVVARTLAKYLEAFRRLTGRELTFELSPDAGDMMTLAGLDHCGHSRSGSSRGDRAWFFRSVFSLGGLLLGLVLAGVELLAVRSDAEAPDPFHRSGECDRIPGHRIAGDGRWPPSLVRCWQRFFAKSGWDAWTGLQAASFGFLEGQLFVMVCILVTVAFFRKQHGSLEARLPRYFFGALHVSIHVTPAAAFRERIGRN